jgi:hypothetical protein
MKTGLLKFKYGEEIITEYEDSGDFYFIQNTATLIPADEGHWHLVTWLPYTQIRSGFNLPKSEVWFATNLSTDMEMYYKNWQKALKDMSNNQTS